MADFNEAKKQLDVVITKSRVHLYKPIQIAEILYRHRQNADFDLAELEAYRKSSKNWRDAVSLKLVGRICTSSAKFQDNVFESNAMPPKLIKLLGTENEKTEKSGVVEAYIYKSLEKRLQSLKELSSYLEKVKPEKFSLSDFISKFQRDKGLARSVDKAYEITVYALFDTLVRRLEAQITLSIPKNKRFILKEFKAFAKAVLGLTPEQSSITLPARLYRHGVANAADRGLDMWANFGPAIQIKHLTLTEDNADDIVSHVTADKIVIVCRTVEKNAIKNILAQIGFADRIQAIITQNNLERWYSKCFTETYRNDLGVSLLKDLHKEFLTEFPSLGDALDAFLKERGYDKIALTGIFSIK